MQYLRKAVVCPVYNEAGTWRRVCDRLKDQFDLVVVVDDGSAVPLTVSTGSGVDLLRHDTNMGKGRALETGFRHCLHRGAQVVATIDADGEHDPRSFVRALALYGGEGVLNLSRAEIFPAYGYTRRARNLAISHRLSNELGVTLEDTQSGMRLYSAAALRAALQEGIPPGYAVETALLRAARAHGLAIREIAMTHPGYPRDEKRLYNLRALWSDVAFFASALIRRPRRIGVAQTQHPSLARPKATEVRDA